MKELKIELSRGCTNFSLSVKGKEFHSLTDEEQVKVKQRLCKWINESADLNELLVLLTEHYCDDYTCDDEPCEQCGDYGETYTWNIK